MIPRLMNLHEGRDGRLLLECFACRTSYDILSAEFCTCLTSRPSLVCLACGHCFCSADEDYKRRFWAASPLSLRLSARRRMRSTSGESVPASATIPRVLVVDDDEEIRWVAATVIQRLGYVALTASGPVEALEIVRRDHPGLVLTDALMPQMDGRELCRTIKHDETISDTTVVVMSSVYTSPRYKYEALKEFGADDYLPKPIDIEALGIVLQKYCRAAAQPQADCA